ncbi:MAG: methionyl-tRNA formyltransferase [bacterium]|nr:methionyl-tRNA formyltransferase [bacterium]
MKSIKSVFIGGKQIGVNCLRVLLENKQPPALVIANPDDTGADTWHESLVRAATEAHVPAAAGKKLSDPEVLASIRAVKPDIIFAIGGTQIISKDILAIPSQGTINIHPALLPKYRGRFSTAHAIFNGEKQTGATLHFMDEGIDSGPIILQEPFPIEDGDTGKIVYENFTRVGTKLFREFLLKLDTGAPIQAIPQNESEATYYPKGLPGGGEIDWSWDGETIKRFIRAMTFEPFPPPSFAIGGKKMVVVDEKYFPGYIPKADSK